MILTQAVIQRQPSRKQKQTTETHTPPMGHLGS